MRTKTIAINDSDDLKVRIGALTLEQVEAYLAADMTLDKLGIPKSSYNLICDGLNNARKNDDPIWTEERIRKEFDLETVKQLQEEIMAYSAMKIVKADASADPPKAAE